MTTETKSSIGLNQINVQSVVEAVEGTSGMEFFDSEAQSAIYQFTLKALDFIKDRNSRDRAREVTDALNMVEEANGSKSLAIEVLCRAVAIRQDLEK